MNIAIIGAGNVGGALALKWAQKGHRIFLGVHDLSSIKAKELLNNPNITAHLASAASGQADVILISVPAPAAIDATVSLGNTEGKIIIDAMNIIGGQGPAGFQNTSDAILAHTATKDVVKCFNTTGFNNMLDTKYESNVIDMFVAGDSQRGKQMAVQLSGDAGFAECYDVGGNEKFTLMEQFAWFWINLAMFQGHGREIAFKLLKR